MKSAGWLFEFLDRDCADLPHLLRNLNRSMARDIVLSCERSRDLINEWSLAQWGHHPTTEPSDKHYKDVCKTDADCCRLLFFSRGSSTKALRARIKADY